ncbi:MAG TPA: zinc-dependent alcohol dehydrogenase family protein [Candidatus Methylacidiphilales bacterium]|jgi:propanol-preferring alcohol dehydrogenase|nr:zinc-dependent alcohol dehydrogenase family protein [Candidatus Methylacidiphilales bacterium]
MKAAVLHAPKKITERPLVIEDVSQPTPGPGQVLLKVRVCGVCRTDLHIVEGDLPPKHDRIIPGHQIVGEILAGPAGDLPLGTRVGVSWMGGVDGTCPFCRRGEENLCDAPVFTGWSVNGGYAEYAVARADFVHPLPPSLDDLHAAPLLCAGIIGFRALRVAGTQKGERVGLFGFGASAHLALPVLTSWGCEVYVSTRGKSHAKLAESLGAKWVGGEKDKPPVALDRAIVFAPAGEVVVLALASLRKGGVVSINAIHLDQMPAFDYDSLLWGERQIRSVANMTRADARDFLDLAARIKLQPKVTQFSIEQVNEAMLEMNESRIDGAVAIVP